VWAAQGHQPVEELINWTGRQGNMAATTASGIRLTPAELDDRRLAVENTIGTLRIENMEPDETTKRILYLYAHGEIELGEASRLLHESSAAIV
jgi:hypothetical protein